MGKTRKLSVEKKNSRMAVKIWQATYAAGRKNPTNSKRMMKTTEKMQLEVETCLQK